MSHNSLVLFYLYFFLYFIIVSTVTSSSSSLFCVLLSNLVNNTQCIFYLRNYNFHLLMFDLLYLSSSFLNIWNAVIINLLVAFLLRLPPVSFLSPFLLIFLLIKSCIHLFFCMHGNFTWMPDIMF